MKKLLIILMFISINVMANDVCWNARGGIRITQTTARDVFMTYLTNKTSTYTSINIQDGPRIGSYMGEDTNTVYFSVRTTDKTIRDGMIAWFADKIQTYSTYIGTGSFIYTHKCFDGVFPSSPCVESLTWSK